MNKVKHLKPKFADLESEDVQAILEKFIRIAERYRLDKSQIFSDFHVAFSETILGTRVSPRGVELKYRLTSDRMNEANFLFNLLCGFIYLTDNSYKCDSPEDDELTLKTEQFIKILFKKHRKTNLNILKDINVQVELDKECEKIEPAYRHIAPLISVLKKISNRRSLLKSQALASLPNYLGDYFKKLYTANEDLSKISICQLGVYLSYVFHWEPKREFLMKLLNHKKIKKHWILENSSDSEINEDDLENAYKRLKKNKFLILATNR